MSFFHTTPSGRIINRLTKDTSDVDRVLADFASSCVRAILSLTSTILLVGIVTPFTLSALVPILLMFYWLYAYFQVRVAACATAEWCVSVCIEVFAPCLSDSFPPGKDSQMPLNRQVSVRSSVLTASLDLLCTLQ